mmetsp:Transcript_5976/g.13861  ORF Transcript_5976/g.13861 Transcript_5976/m.13861 type:complete len:746 (-) Transcript_5976:24-2261(-)
MSSAMRKSKVGGPSKHSNSNLSSSSNMASKTNMKSTHRSSRMGAQSSRKSGMSTSQAGGGHSQAIVVIDPETGLEATPVSLLEIEPTVVQQQTGSLSPRSRESSDKLDSSSSAAFSKSGWSSDGTTTPTNAPFKEDEPDEKEPETISGPVAEAPQESPEKKKKKPLITLLADDPPKPTELQNEVAIVLSETSTTFILDLPSSCIADDDPDLDTIKKKNAAYLAMKKAKAGQDKYADRAMQTLNGANKNKDAQATPAPTQSVGVDVTNYEIHDAIQALKDGENEQEEEMMASNKPQGKSGGMDGLNAVQLLVGGKPDIAKAAESILGSGNFKTALTAMERIVVQNIYHAQQLKYRDLLVEPPPEVSVKAPGARGGKLELLWSYECDLSKGRNVSCMAWNKLQPDLLAVGYGEFEFTKQGNGLVLFWSLKNPEYPMKVYRTECSVTSLAFADKSVNLLAVGLYDGTVAVYDVRKPEDKPVLESSYTGGKHSDCVWEVRWVDKGSERGEALVSVSSDGRVTQWSMSKGLEHTDLIKLKRVATHKKVANTKNEAFISRMASGMCADFNSKDSSLYIVGTEEGTMHKCSVSYNEQYLETYTGHSGPVYKVEWSPFLPSAFLSCSADWAIKLWHQEQDSAMLTMQSSADYVADIEWSPWVSTIFASVTGDGFVCIWDMSISTLDPIVTEKILPRKPSCIKFSPNSNVVVSGDNTGRVQVYRLSGIDDTQYTPEEQVARLEKALAAKDAAEG